jgi:hypothetical protein
MTFFNNIYDNIEIRLKQIHMFESKIKLIYGKND